jgi:hypothetical protein
MRSRVDCPGREEGGPFIAAVLGLNPLTLFFVPVTRVGYKVDLASQI